MRVLQLLYFMAPAYVANMAPPFVRYWKGWNRPISRRWLGSHKTVVGFGAGVLGAVLVTWLQARLDWDRAIVDYDHWLDLGVRMGTGAMLGDSVKSLFKRRRRVAPGATWIPFDQLDFVLGALILVWPRAALTWTDVAVVIALSFAGHIVVNHIGYGLGVRDAKW